jgi:hypothetical protein
MSDLDKQSLRGFLAQLKKELPEELLRIQEPVRTHLDITSLVYELERLGKSPVVVFENIEGHTMPVVTNIAGNRKVLALALGVGSTGCNDDLKPASAVSALIARTSMRSSAMNTQWRNAGGIPMERMRAWATGLRRNVTSCMRGRRMSPTNWPCPRMYRSSSLCGSRAPMPSPVTLDLSMRPACAPLAPGC